VSLTMKQRTLGEIAVVACSGRIVEGAETTALDKQVRDLQVVYRYFVLDLHDVAFVDSAGLGLLVRLLSRLRRASGDLKLCGVAPNIQKSLNVSRLSSVLASYESVESAVAAFQRPSESGDEPSRETVDILCVHRSNDVLAYLHELLRQAGYGLMTSTNVSDAATLLIATRPRIVVIDAQSRAVGMSGRFGGLIGDAHVVELPPTFSIEDAGEAGQRLLSDIARVSGSPAP
jgi:anti-sigma B factor antagonist